MQLMVSPVHYRYSCHCSWS